MVALATCAPRNPQISFRPRALHELVYSIGGSGERAGWTRPGARHSTAGWSRAGRLCPTERPLKGHSKKVRCADVLAKAQADRDRGAHDCWLKDL